MNSKRLNLFYILWLTALGLLLGFLGKLDYFNTLNLLVSQYIQGYQPEWFILLSKCIYYFEFTVIVIGLFLFFFLKKHKKNNQAKLILLCSFSWVITSILKSFYSIPRPILEEVSVYAMHPGFISIIKNIFKLDVTSTINSSYPSGHVFTYVSFFGALYYLRKNIFKKFFLQNTVKIGCIVLIGLVGISRISLGAHWFSDTIGGYLLGFAWLMTTIKIFPATGKTQPILQPKKAKNVMMS
jgi:membrane-associated phospholipid phosphatase